MTTKLTILTTVFLLNTILLIALIRWQKPLSKHLLTGFIVGLILSGGALWYIQVNSAVAFPLMAFFLSSPFAIPGLASLFDMSRESSGPSYDLWIQIGIVLSNAGSWSLFWSFIAEKKFRGLGYLVGGIIALMVIGTGLIVPTI